jgi:bilirubin oxidase
MALTRRIVLKAGTATTGLLLAGRYGVVRAQGSLDPSTISKYASPLVVPPAMPRTSVTSEGIDYYEIAVRQFQQQILPAGSPVTTVWSYGSVNHTGTFNYPAFTIEATAAKPVRVKWINQLVDGSGHYLPHLLPVDPTIHWANPPGPIDSRPNFSSTPGRYLGPAPMVVHLHGGHSAFDSDGYAEGWFLPSANNLSGFTRKGTRYASPYGTPNDFQQGFAVFQYANDQRAATLWYHDHTLGMTRLNVYAGPAGFYLVRGGSADLASGLPAGPYEIPIAIQDRSFNDNGSLFYPDSREFFDSYGGPYIPGTPVSPIWNPEFFGNTIVVNGRTWPSLRVEKRRYRLRFLNGTQGRTLILKIVANPLAARPATAGLPFWLIGTEGGFVPAPVQLEQLLMANAERNDVIVDFTNVAAGTSLYLVNEGPDGVYNGTFDPADPNTTGQVMRFDVVARNGNDNSIPPVSLTLPAFTSLGGSIKTRQVALFEQAFDAGGSIGEIPVEVMLGTPAAGRLAWDDPISEKPALGATETWEIFNTTVDAHPIHIHEVLFQVVNRQPFTATQNPSTGALSNIALGTARGPEAHEKGLKDTVIALPGQVTRVKARFDLPNLYVWHCHIVEHEDNEMMRPYTVTQNPAVNLGAALGYALLAMTGVKVSFSNSKSGVVGDMGLGPNGAQNFADGFITGSYFVDPTANNGKSNNVVITGGTVARALSQAASDAYAAANQATALATTQPAIAKIDNNATISGSLPLNVVQVGYVDLKSTTLTIQGGADSEFVIQVPGKFKFSGGARVVLAGGVLPSRVLFNVMGSGEDVALSGASTVAGTVLARQRKVSMSGASAVTGTVIAGGDVALTGGSVIRLVD